MRFKATEVVRGATRFEGKIDGTDMKSATIFVDVSLDQEGRGFGFRTEAMRCLDLAVVDKIKALPFPFKAELEVEQRATKNSTSLVVLDVKPLPNQSLPKA